MSDEAEPRVSEPKHASEIIPAVMKALPEMSPEVAARVAELEAERELEFRRQQMRRLRERWNAPKRHLQCKLSKTAPLWSIRLNSLNAKIGSGLLVGLVGGRGGGKTQMAVEVMREATRRLRSSLFTTAMEFFMEVKRSYRVESDLDERQVIGPYKRRKLLVIDEFGKRSESDWENNLLFSVINSRYNDMLDTILIDNRTKEEFTKTIGPSLADRMNECGGIIECKWPSFRQ
jgi:DNA replication protein DnaC